MDNFYIKLEKSQLDSLVQGYKNVVDKVITTAGSGEINYGVLGIRNFTKNIHEDGSWDGKIYNNVVRFWNDTTSVKLYNIINTYYEKNLAALNNIAGIYSGLELEVGGTDINATTKFSDELYSVLNEKLALTDEYKVNFVLVNINVFLSTVGGAAKHEIPNKINEINAYLDQNFKKKSTTLDQYVEKVKDINNQFGTQIQECLMEYYEVLKKNVERLREMEETSIKDVNKNG